MSRPLAWRHLQRVHELTTTQSANRVFVERKLASLPEVVEAAAKDGALAEEALVLARDRGWRLPEPQPYAWGKVGDESDPLPRLVRILERDAFELDEAARTTDDDEVRSLLVQVRNERAALVRALERIEPIYTLPGAK